MSIATNRSLLAALLLASSTLLGAATLELPSGFDISFNPDPVTQGSVVTITVHKAPSFPVEIEFSVGGISIGRAIISAANGSKDFLVPAASNGQTWTVTATDGSYGGELSGTVAP